MPTARLDRHGQTGHLPKKFALARREVGVRRVGDAVRLVPTPAPPAGFTAALQQFTADFMEERSHPTITSREPGGSASLPPSSTIAPAATRRPRSR